MIGDLAVGRDPAFFKELEHQLRKDVFLEINVAGVIRRDGPVSDLRVQLLNELSKFPVSAHGSSLTSIVVRSSASIPKPEHAESSTV